MQKIEINRLLPNKEFEPSMKTILRIIKVLLENGSMGRTTLSLETNLQYSRLAKHIAWLEKKNFIQLIVENNQVNVVLTKNGRAFAAMLLV